MVILRNRAVVSVVGRKKEKMLETNIPEAMCRLDKRSAVCPILVFLHGCKPASLCVVIKSALVPNRDRIWQNGARHVAHFLSLFYTNPSPKKSEIDRCDPNHNKTDTVFCSRDGFAQICGELRDSQATACRA